MNDTMAAKGEQSKRWCFTINNPTDDDKFWENAEQQEQLEYLIVQLEVEKKAHLTTRAFSFSRGRTDSLGSRTT